MTANATRTSVLRFAGSLSGLKGHVLRRDPCKSAAHISLGSFCSAIELRPQPHRNHCSSSSGSEAVLRTVLKSGFVLSPVFVGFKPDVLASTPPIGGVGCYGFSR